MDQAKRLDSMVRWTMIAILFALPAALTIACAGANGDPAPAAQEAGATTTPAACVDAGATE